jgi:hypothetical protein
MSRLRSVVSEHGPLVATIVTVLVIVSTFAFVRLRPSATGSTRPPTGGQAAAEAVGTEPDPDEDIHSLPTLPSDYKPADKATFTPPSDDGGQPYDVTKNWDIGVSEGSAPVNSYYIVTSTVWGGFVGGAPVAVYAGYAGYDHPDNGAIYVLYGRTDARGFDFEMSFLLPVKGATALTVVDGHDDGTVVMRSESGQTVIYDLTSETVEIK